MYRQNTYNEGSYYELLPVARKAVVPGESVAIDVTTVFETEAFGQNIMTGGIASLYAFYVPYRLVWDQWVAWIADPQNAATPPTSTTAWNLLFEGGTLAMSTLGRRAYKLIYNQYFGWDIGVADYWYSNIATDTDVSLKRLRTTDQFNGKVQASGEAPAINAVYPVVASNVTIDLNELRRRLKDAKSNRRSDMTGDKYVDAMARMGVNLDWRVQNAPEMLGVAHREFLPKDTRATDPVNTGRAWSRYQEQLQLKTSRKFFAEHGVVFVVCAIRPHIFSVNARAAGDAAMLNINRDLVFLGDNDAGTWVPEDPMLGAGAPGNNFRAPRFSAYRYGQNLTGNTSYTSTGNQPWVPRLNMTVNDVVYPSASLITAYVDQLPSGVLALCTSAKFVGPSPVRPNII